MLRIYRMIGWLRVVSSKKESQGLVIRELLGGASLQKRSPVPRGIGLHANVGPLDKTSRRGAGFPFRGLSTKSVRNGCSRNTNRGSLWNSAIVTSGLVSGFGTATLLLRNRSRIRSSGVGVMCSLYWKGKNIWK